MDASSGINTSNGKPLKCNQNVQVYLRVRPTNAREKLIRSQEVVEVVSTREVCLKPSFLDTRTSKKFTFDRAFDTNSKQNDVYNAVVAPYIEEVLAGYNCTVFAYGQTGTGKTYTMIGEEQPELSSGWDDDTKTGIIPRALNHLFDELRMTELEFSMRISYLELYNEELCDLLSTDDTVKIRIYDDVNKKGSVIVQGLEEIPVHSKDDVYKLLAKGQERRRTASTLMNAQSSRSHTIFSIIVHIKENGLDGDEMLKIGKLNLVDLAGSENISKAGNEKGIRARETVNINQSLLTLGRVITALVERTPHIPYRESKLTRLLQESLGGRTKTSIIATISPGHKDFEETLSTLEYAHRAKNIQNKPEANQKLSKKTVIKEYTEEIDRLKQELQATRDKNGIYLPQETYADLMYKAESTTKELNDKVVLMKVLKEDLAKKEAIFKEVSLCLVEKEELLRKTEDDLSNTKHELITTKKNLNKTKRRYAEKKVILDRHVRTEETLTNQAKELIEVVEAVEVDAKDLHDTIDRRKEVDLKNQSITEQFVQKLMTRVQTMQGNLTNLSQNCHQITDSVSGEWNAFVAKQQTLEQESRSVISNVEKVFKNAMDQTATLVSTFQQEHSHWTSEQQSAVQDMAKAIERTVDSLRKTISSDIETLKSTQVEQQNSQKELHETIMTMCRKVDQRNVLHFQNQKAALSGIRELVEQFMTSRSRIAQFVEVSKKANEKREKMLKNFYESMCNQIKADRDELDRLSVVCQDVETTTNAVQTAITETSTSIDENINHQQKDTKELEDQNKLYDECKKEHRTIVEQFLQNNLLKATESVCDVLKKSANRQIEVLDDTNKESLTRWDKFSCSLQEKSSNCSIDHQIQIASLQQTLDRDRVALSEFRSSSVAMNKQLHRNTNTYQNQTNANLTELSQDVDRFLREEFTPYQPTGQTPVRKTINYPKDLAMTSPHDRIVRRFWRERGMLDMDLSQTICEDNEDISVLCRSLNGDEMRNSTPLRNSDDYKRLKDLQISNINQLSKIGDEAECEENKENMIVINETTLE
ncbi:kinesin-like protein Klp61F [Uranotaenia lowii]|uniref:kinesin-like protein Klp61F n=1 Tax=Uranotaenia lowii TaxID=190385 RepID=UPI00247A8907|nr:kinesin-like protein Klp61F [Uranotaenia lowii]